MHVCIYQISLRRGVGLGSRGRRKSIAGNTGVPMIYTGLSYITGFGGAVCFVYLV